jgi:uncharacterized protein RhaS with RHS repeats
LHYNYFRDYEAGTGRYIESDPIGLEGGRSTFSYVELNPLGYSDPRGLAVPAAPCGLVANALGFTLAAKTNSDRDIAKLPGNRNGQKDAVRHCVWACLMGESPDIGKSCAQKIADAHEDAQKHDDPPQPEDEDQMDRANNRAGVCLAGGPGSCTQKCKDKLGGCGLYGPGGVLRCPGQFPGDPRHYP